MIQKFDAGEGRYWPLVAEIGLNVWNMYVPMRGRPNWQIILNVALYCHMIHLIGNLVEEVGRAGLQCIRIESPFS